MCRPNLVAVGRSSGSLGYVGVSKGQYPKHDWLARLESGAYILKQTCKKCAADSPNTTSAGIGGASRSAPSCINPMKTSVRYSERERRNYGPWTWLVSLPRHSKVSFQPTSPNKCNQETRYRLWRSILSSNSVQLEENVCDINSSPLQKSDAWKTNLRVPSRKLNLALTCWHHCYICRLISSTKISVSINVGWWTKQKNLLLFFDVPKSDILQFPSWSQRMLSALRSRWRIPKPWRYLNPLRIWAVNDLIIGSSN